MKAITATRKRACPGVIMATEALLKSCKWFMKQLDDGVLVRDISRDGEPGWSLRMLKFTASLSEVSIAIEEAEGGAEENNPHPDLDFCSRCREHTSFEKDEDGEWLSVCCSSRAVETDV